MKTKQSGFTLVEVISVIILMLIIGAAGIWSFGQVEQRQLNTKVANDLHLINTAKANWRSHHMRMAFPTDETDRFTAIQPYLNVGLLPVSSLTALEPTAVTYTINGEDTSGNLISATATKGSLTFNLSANNWSP